MRAVESEPGAPADRGFAPIILFDAGPSALNAALELFGIDPAEWSISGIRGAERRYARADRR